MSVAPQSISQSTPMRPECTPIVHYTPLHPSSCRILSKDSLDNPDNPRLNTVWPRSITDWGTQVSIPAIVFGASTNTQGASGHPPPSTGPIIGPKPDIGFHQTLTLFPLIVIISCCLIPSNPVLTTPVHTLISLLLHPCTP